MAENFVIHLKNMINTVWTDYFAFLVAVVTDASGECRKARKILALKYPDILFIDCYAHQVCCVSILLLVILTLEHQINLVVGDYFKSEASVLEFTDNAMELITWL